MAQAVPASKSAQRVYSFTEEEQEYIHKNPQSQAQFQEARKVLAGGNSRLTAFFKPFPFYVDRGEGCCIYDIDGNVRIDFFNNATSLILGYCHPAVVKASAEQLEKGTAFANPTLPEVELAKMLVERIPSVDQVRFTNSGTEGILMAVRAARAFTGKPKIAKFEGGYHGTTDHMTISVRVDPSKAGDVKAPVAVPSSAGITPNTLADLVILPYNDREATRALVEKHRHEIAAIIVEPVLASAGYIPGTRAFLETLRELADGRNMLLIFDEVQTFRVAPGGIQELYGIIPDITVLGKIIGGGFPIGGFGGRADIMAAFDGMEGPPKVPHAGTFNGNPITMRAGVATLKELTPEVYHRLRETGNALRAELQEMANHYQVPAQITGEASLFNIHMADQPVYDYRTAQTANPVLTHKLFLHLLNQGIYLGSKGGGNLSVPMGEAELTSLCTAWEKFLHKVK
jgi:glutamate-1-semialdehyde 2,1-aminomutase